MYDFANSAYAVIVLAVVFNNYFASIIAGGAQGLLYSFGDFSFRVPGATVFSFVNTVALAIVAITSPVLGALADYSGRKKRYLAVAWLLGSLTTTLLFFIGEGNLILASLLFIISNIGFAGGSVFYDAFLPEISNVKNAGRISGFGYAAGYLGGGLLLVLILVIDRNVPAFEYNMSFMMAGIWWLVFTIPAILWLHDTKSDVKAGSMGGYLKIGFRRVKHTLQHINQLKTLKRFLFAYLIFGTGIESVIRLASIFGGIELGMTQAQLVLFFLVIQGTALVGAVFFGWLADRSSNRFALLITLAIWIVTLIWAYELGMFFNPLDEFWIIGVLAGIAMGGSQGVSRALQSVILPAGMSNEFFGFFSMAGKLANILGMLSFGIVTWITGDMQSGIVSLAIFFIVGAAILWGISEADGRREAVEFVKNFSTGV
jgi:MFS transporter, UMF1 family